MEGYDVEVVGEVPIDLYCTICLKLMRDAIQMKCGHGMCQACLQKLADSCKERNMEVTCPSCRKVVNEDQIFQNVMLDRIVAAMKVKCSNYKLGCEWIGELQSSNNHLLRDCNYQLVKCSFEGCNEEILRNILTEHETKCEYRVVQCDYCTDAFLPNQLVNHLEVCEYHPMECTNEMCSELIPRCKSEEHLQLDCLYEEIQCSFHSIGCCDKFLRKDFNSHLHEYNQKHMLLLLNDSREKSKHIEALQEQNRVVTQNAVESENRLLTKIDELREQIVEVKEESVMMNGKFEQRKAQYEDVITKLINIEQKFQDLTCLAPDELTCDKRHLERITEQKTNNDECPSKPLKTTSCSESVFSATHLANLVMDTFQVGVEESIIEFLRESFERESKTHHELWLSKEIKSFCGVSEMKKADLPVPDSYWKIVNDTVKQNSKMLNFQQISRMQSYSDLLRSHGGPNKKIFEIEKNSFHFKNHLFIKYQYSQLDANEYKNIDNLEVRMCKFGPDMIWVKSEKAKEVYAISKNVKKTKFVHVAKDDHHHSVPYTELIAKEFVVDDWFLLEIVYPV